MKSDDWKEIEFHGLLNSVVWTWPPAARIVWITLLIVADENGVVHLTSSEIAERARMDVPTCRDVLVWLLELDHAGNAAAGTGRKLSRVGGKFRLMWNKDGSPE